MIGRLFKKIDKEIYVIFFLALIFFYKLFLNPTKIIYPAEDLLNVYYFMKLFLTESLQKFHTVPLWFPYNFSGVPFIGDPESTIFSPFTLLYLIFPVYFAFGFSFFFDTFLIGLFTYLFAKLINIGKFGSLVSAICMMFGGYFIILIYPGHIYIADTIVWFPLLLYFTEQSVQKNKLLFAVLAGLPLGFISVAGHIQPGLYAFFSASVYLLLRLVISKRLTKDKKLLLFPIVSGIVAFCLFAIELIPILELSQATRRVGGVSYLFASDFSLPPVQLLSFILPRFFGTPLDLSYWGKANFWSICGYAGIIPLFLATSSLFKKGNKYVAIFVVLAIFAVLYSFGNYSFLFPFFFKFVPTFNLFRVPSRFLFVYGFSLSILAGFGASWLFGNKKPRGLLPKFATLTTILGFLIQAGIFVFNSFSARYILFDKYVLKKVYAVSINHKLILDNILIDLFVFSAFLIFTGVYLFAFQRIKSQKILKVILLIAVVSNLWFYWLKFYDVKNISSAYVTDPEVKKVSLDKGEFRVFDMTGKLFSQLENKKIEEISGVNPAAISYYRNFLWQIGDHLNEPYAEFIQVYNIKNKNILKLLNVKYILSEQKLENQDFTLKLKQKNYLYEIPTLPRAYIVPDAVHVRNTTEEFRILREQNFDPKQKILLLDNIKNQKGSQTFKVLTVNSGINKATIGDFYSKSGFLVLSEIWYPGWRAFDNGKEVKIYKADSVLRAIQVSTGSHKVVFVYDPSSYKIGKYISIFSVLGFVIFVYLKRKKFNN